MVRKNIFVIKIIWLIIFCLASPCSAAFSGSVVKIIDGDSIVISAQKKSIEVRLYGVDCPEYDQPFSKSAKKFVASRIYGKTVTVSPEYHDKYNRLVAIISYGTRVLNRDLVDYGFAWVYPHYCKKRFCKSWKNLERNARQQGKGLWAGGKPVAPWKWRRK